MAKKEEIIEAKEFQLVSAYDGMDEETKAEFEEEMGDLDNSSGIDCRRIKVPTGKSKAFEVETDDPDDPELMKEIQAVILYTHKINTRWEGEYNADNRLPACSSMDAVIGVNPATGETTNCSTCPYNQFREDGTGKDCKNMRRIYMMLSGSPYLYLLSVPPTSAKDVNNQLRKIMGSSSVPYTHLIVTFKLVAATSKNGNDYNKITVERTGILPDDAFAATKAARDTIKQQYRGVAITSTDYEITQPEQDRNTTLTPPVGMEDFMTITDDEMEELPFD